MQSPTKSKWIFNMNMCNMWNVDLIDLCGVPWSSMNFPRKIWEELLFTTEIEWPYLSSSIEDNKTVYTMCSFSLWIEHVATTKCRSLKIKSTSGVFHNSFLKFVLIYALMFCWIRTWLSIVDLCCDSYKHCRRKRKIPTPYDFHTFI